MRWGTYVSVTGWPKDCSTVEEKVHYLRKYLEVEQLEASKIGDKKNLMLNDLNKRCMNSLLGKWAERQDTLQTTLMHCSQAFYKFLENPNLKEKKFALVNEESMILSWRDEAFAIGESGKESIVHAGVTTSLARIKLYRELLKPLGKRVLFLYCDTDSAVFISGEDLEDLPNGNFMGKYR